MGGGFRVCFPFPPSCVIEEVAKEGRPMGLSMSRVRRTWRRLGKCVPSGRRNRKIKVLIGPTDRLPGRSRGARELSTARVGTECRSWALVVVLLIPLHMLLVLVMVVIVVLSGLPSRKF
jgi:hypothetical protein